VAIQALDRLVAKLTSRSEAERRDARRALLQLGDAAVSALATALASRDPEVFFEAADVLGCFPPTTRAPAIVATRGLLEGLVCGTSTQAKAKKWTNSRPLAVGLLAGLDLPDAVELFTAALRDVSPAVQSAAADALAEIPEHLRPIAREHACDTLIYLLNSAAPPTGPTEPPDIRPAMARALGRLGCREAVPHLVAALVDANTLCVHAAGALGDLRDPAAIVPLIDVMFDAQKFWVPRGNAAVVIGHMGSCASAAIPALREALTLMPNDTTWDARCTEGVEDALSHLTDDQAACLLKGRGYRFEMWGVY